MRKLKLIFSIFLVLCLSSSLLRGNQKIPEGDSSWRYVYDEGPGQVLIQRAKEKIATRPSDAKAYALQAVEFAKSKNDSTVLYEGLHLLGMVSFYEGDYPAAFKYYLDALRISELNQDTSSISRTSNNIGVLMEKTSKLEEAITYYRKTLLLNEKTGDRDGVATVLNNLGNIYKNTDSTDQALAYYQESLNIRESCGDSLYMAYCYGNIGNVYIDQNKLNLAEQYYHEALLIFRELGDLNALARTHLNMSLILREKGQLNKAVNLLLDGLKLARETEEKDLLSRYFEAIADTYARIGDYEKAYVWQVKHHDINDSILNQESLAHINELRIKYQSESKAKEIELLKKEHELVELRLQKQAVRLKRSKTQLGILVLFTFFVSGTAYMIFLSYRLAQKARFDNEKLKYQEAQIRAIIKTQESERNRFAKDLHDVLGQYLTALKMNIINFEPRQALNEVKRKNIYDNAMELFDDIYAELRNITFNIMPLVLVEKGLIPAIEELSRKINRTGKVQMIVYQYEMNEKLSLDCEVAIYRIIQEIVNNAIKHSASTAINVVFTNHIDFLNIMIETNGKGFSKNALIESKGKGWGNIRSRLEMLKGTIEIDSDPVGVNNTFIIDIPFNNEKTKSSTC